MIKSNMNGFKIDPEKLGVKYSYIRGEEYKRVEDYIKFVLINQHEKPNSEKWNNFYTEIRDGGEKLPYWLTKNNKRIYRWNYQYIYTLDTQLEAKYQHHLVSKIAKLLQRGDSVYEFGCGCGHNLELIRTLKPEVEVYGFDISQSAIDIVRSKKIKCDYADMTNPNFNLEVKKESSILFTFGAMEQLGNDFEKFFEFSKKFEACIHVEPLKEMYNKYDVFDVLALEYHNKRNYLGNYLSHLNNNNIELHVERTTFGNIFNEGYMVLSYDSNIRA